jgi:hypothetical protein
MNNNASGANNNGSGNATGMGSTRRSTRRQNGGGMKTVGTKAQVWHGTAKKTSGGLTRKDLMKTKKGRIVSKKKHAAGKKALKRLAKAGYKAKKGTFKLFKRG